MSYQKVNHGYLITGNLLDNTTGASYDLSGQILDVMVKKSYIEDAFPLYVIDFKTTQQIRDIMRDNNVSVALRISYYNVDDIQTEEEIDTTEVTELGVLFDGVIRIYDKPYATTTSKVEEENDDAETQKETAPFVYYRMSGIPEDLISKNETNMNAIYKDCELIDVAVHMLTSVDTTSKMYIQESVNKNKQSQVLIPPVSLVPAIEFLDSMYYYIYDHDANLFIDSDAIYLYDPISEDTPKTNIIECNILTAEATENTQDIQRPSVNEDGNIKLSYRNLPTYNRSKDIMDHTLGSHTVFYYYDENFNLVSETETNETYEKVRYLWKKLSVNNHELLKKNESLAIALPHINPTLVNPLTLCRIISAEYPIAEGDYNIVSNSYIFSSTDLKHFKSNMVLTLLKK